MLSWKGLPGTNALAYYKNPLIVAIKSFIVQAPGVTILIVAQGALENGRESDVNSALDGSTYSG